MSDNTSQVAFNTISISLDLPVKVCHVDAHMRKNCATKEHQNNEQNLSGLGGSGLGVKGELFIAQWARETSGHLGRDATYRWAHDRGMDLTIEAITQSTWNSGWWLGYQDGEAWKIGYFGSLPRTRQGKRYMLSMMEVTTIWL
ncbi:hypothetical protein QYF61_001134 [Mycteria americana]|uniref:Uncharacterized protein n=1 Tax=Mycteria americana TaxID=33587 RepID=A0AAN7N7V8_MYCAM|nr:hypothetical protein QYF61_001134 [Mycteria americana]